MKKKNKKLYYLLLYTFYSLLELGSWTQGSSHFFKKIIQLIKFIYNSSVHDTSFSKTSSTDSLNPLSYFLTLPTHSLNPFSYLLTLQYALSMGLNASFEIFQFLMVPTLKKCVEYLWPMQSIRLFSRPIDILLLELATLIHILINIFDLMV